MRNYTALGFDNGPEESIGIENAGVWGDTYIRLKAELFIVIIIYHFAILFQYTSYWIL